MKVAARITVATAVVVAFASAAYAFFDVRARAAERRATLEVRAREIASTLRSRIEAQTSAAVRAAQATLDAVKTKLDATEDGFKSGAVPEAEVLKARTDFALAKQQLE